MPFIVIFNIVMCVLFFIVLCSILILDFLIGVINKKEKIAEEQEVQLDKYLKMKKYIMYAFLITLFLLIIVNLIV